MSQVDFFIKSGDTLPALYTTLTDATGVPIDLTDATGVSFRMALEGSDTLAVNHTAAIEGLPVDGTVQYNWGPGDTDVPGSYFASFVVTYPAGSQTFPSDDFISILVQPGLTSVTAPVSPFCSVADVKAITCEDVSERSLTVAWSVLEGIIGRPAYELQVTLDDVDKQVLTTRDQYWLQRAVAWQAAWVESNPDFFSAYDVSNINQSGQSATLGPDGLVVAPMARRALRFVTWMKTRSLKIQRPFPYSRLLNPTVNDSLGHPWSSM